MRVRAHRGHGGFSGLNGRPLRRPPPAHAPVPGASRRIRTNHWSVQPASRATRGVLYGPHPSARARRGNVRGHPSGGSHHPAAVFSRSGCRDPWVPCFAQAQVGGRDRSDSFGPFFFFVFWSGSASTLPLVFRKVADERIDGRWLDGRLESGILFAFSFCRLTWRRESDPQPGQEQAHRLCHR